MKKSLLILFVLLVSIGLRAQDAAVVLESLSETDTTVLVAGKTYVYGKKRAINYDLGKYEGEYFVKYVAEADGYLTLNASQTISTSNVKRNGTSLQNSTSTSVISYTDAGTTYSVPYVADYTKGTNGSLQGIALAKGDVFECKTYTLKVPSETNVISLEVVFSTEKKTLELLGSLPASESEWSGAMKYKSYGVSGGVYCSFSSLVDRESVKASVKVGDRVYENVHVAVDSYNSYLCIDGLADTLKNAAAAGLIGAGDEFSVTLSGLKDRVFPDVTLEDQTFTFKMAATACSGVSPLAATNLSLSQAETIVFSFDGKVNIDHANFYLLNLADSSKINLTATVDGTDLIIPVTSAVKGMIPRRFDIIAEGVVDGKGNAITYSTTASTAEAGKLKAHYGMSNGLFEPTVDPAKNAVVISLNKFTLTFPDEVIYNKNGASSDIVLTYEGANYEDVEVATGTVSVSAADPCVAVITLDKEITTPNDYTLNIPGKLFWCKDAGYNADDLSSNGSGKYGYSNSTYYWKYSIPTITPDSISPVDADTLVQLDTLVLYFPEEVEYSADVKVEVLTETSDVITTGSFSYPATGEKNRLIVTMDQIIDSLGAYKVIIPAGAVNVAAAADNKNLTLVYSYVVKPLELAFLSVTPENESVIDVLPSVSFTLNKEVGYLDLGMLIGDDGINAHGAALTKSDDGVYTLDFTYGGIIPSPKLLKGVTYTMTLKAWSSEEASNYKSETPEVVTLTYVGDSEPEKVSEVTLVSADPENESVIQMNENVFTYTFSAPIKVVNAQRNMGQGITQTINYIVEDNKVVVTMPATAMIPGDYIGISLTIEDQDGNRLAGTDDLGYYLFNYTVYKAKEYDYSLAPVSVDPAAGQVESLQGFNFTFGQEVALKEEAVAYILNESGDTINTLGLFVNDEDWTQLSAYLRMPLTAAGNYTLVIPQGIIMSTDYYETETFVVGKLNAELKYAYTVGTLVEPNSLLPVAVTPDTADVELTSLNTIVLTFDKWVAVHEADAAAVKVEVFDASKQESSASVATGTLELNDDFMSVTITLSQELGKGTYNVVIGEGLIYSNDGYNPMLPDLGVSNGAVYNPSLSYTYNVKGVSGIEALQNFEGEVVVYDVNGVAVCKGLVSDVLKGLPRGIYFVNGQKIAIK